MQYQSVYVKVQHEQRQWFLRNCVWVDSSSLNITLAKEKKKSLQAINFFEPFVRKFGFVISSDTLHSVTGYATLIWKTFFPIWVQQRQICWTTPEPDSPHPHASAERFSRYLCKQPLCWHPSTNHYCGGFSVLKKYTSLKPVICMLSCI